MVDIFEVISYPLFDELSHKKLEDFPIADTLLSLLKEEKYQESFNYIEKSCEKENGFDLERYYALNSIWGRYLLNNGHPNFLEHMEKVPDFCFAFSSLEEFTLPTNISILSMGMFYCSEKLNKINLHPNFKNIGPYAFGGCESLKILKLPEGMEEIGDFAFEDASIEILFLPKSIKKISASAKGICQITDVIYDGTYDEYDEIENSLDWVWYDYNCLIILKDDVLYTNHNMGWHVLKGDLKKKHIEELEKRLGRKIYENL